MPGFAPIAAAPLGALPSQAGSITLSPALFTNTQTFFSPTITADVITLAPALFTNTQTFYAPTLTASITLSPSLLTNSQTFYAVTLQASITLSPPLVTNTQAFYAHEVIPGPVELAVPLQDFEFTIFLPSIAYFEWSRLSPDTDDTWAEISASGTWVTVAPDTDDTWTEAA